MTYRIRDMSLTRDQNGYTSFIKDAVCICLHQRIVGSYPGAKAGKCFKDAAQRLWDGGVCIKPQKQPLRPFMSPWKLEVIASSHNFLFHYKFIALIDNPYFSETKKIIYPYLNIYTINVHSLHDKISVHLD
jgi:hypothetical protein